MAATIKQVAKLADVSTATVSYVLNGTGSVTDATRRRVLDAIAELNYQPSYAARSMREPVRRCRWLRGRRAGGQAPARPGPPPDRPDPAALRAGRERAALPWLCRGAGRRRPGDRPIADRRGGPQRGGWLPGDGRVA